PVRRSPRPDSRSACRSTGESRRRRSNASSTPAPTSSSPDPPSTEPRTRPLRSAGCAASPPPTPTDRSGPLRPAVRREPPMELLDWLNTPAFELLGILVPYPVLFGNICALTTVVLALRRNILTWPVQILRSVLLYSASI